MARALFSTRASRQGQGATELDDQVNSDSLELSHVRERPNGRVGAEVGSMLLAASAVFFMLALLSFQGDPLRADVEGANWVGPAGAWIAHALCSAVGIAAWVVPVELVWLAIPAIRGSGVRLTAGRVSGDLLLLLVTASLVTVSAPGATAFGAMPAGGLIGDLFGEVLRGLFSTAGSYIVGGTIIMAVLIERATFSFIGAARTLGSLCATLVPRMRALVGSVLQRTTGASLVGLAEEKDEADGIGTSGALDDDDALLRSLADIDIPRSSDDEPRILRSDAALDEEAPTRLELVRSVVEVAKDFDEKPAPKKIVRKGADASRLPIAVAEEGNADRALEVSDEPSIEIGAHRPATFGVERRKETRGVRAPSAELESSKAPAPDDRAAPTPSASEVEEDVAPASAQPARRTRGSSNPKIIDTSSALRGEKVARGKAKAGAFQLPSFELLDPPSGGRIVIEEGQLRATAQLLEKTLSDYGVSGRVEEIHPGPTVTTFEVSPEAGTKVSKVASLADDLALGLSRKVRIIAPIPGKNRIGFEIPNEVRHEVNIRELVEDRRFQEMKVPLPCVLGRDIIGAPYYADLASMPHVIVAGATGAGKSVGLNVILLSLLHRCTPQNLRLLMIDPKVVELAPFDGIPHMLLPVVTDMKQAANALKWAVDEMERRYQLFANAGTRNITSYNQWVQKVARGEAKAPPAPSKVSAIGPSGEQLQLPAAKDGSDADLPTHMPSIVVVVDEFADLMMQQGKDVETAVARLAQKARAAGMHVILATQRPSVDVITGMIKANFPTRIAFRVAQKVDSRTILDEQGAEHLLGRGDMLVKMNGSSELRRVQGPFVSEEEVQRVCDHLRAQGSPEYDETILQPRDDEEAAGAAGDGAEKDPLYDSAVRIVAETRRCSTSWIQRKLGIGYNRAANIVETMERMGVVGPSNGAKDREILVSPQ